MKIEITYKDNKNGKKEAVGWTIEGQTKEEKYIVNEIRNLAFWGHKEHAIVYDGREGKAGETEFAGKLKWIQRKYNINAKYH